MACPPWLNFDRWLWLNLDRVPIQSTVSNKNLLVVCFVTLEVLLPVYAVQTSTVLPGGTPSLWILMRRIFVTPFFISTAEIAPAPPAKLPEFLISFYNLCVAESPSIRPSFELVHHVLEQFVLEVYHNAMDWLFFLPYRSSTLSLTASPECAQVSCFCISCFCVFIFNFQNIESEKFRQMMWPPPRRNHTFFSFWLKNYWLEKVENTNLPPDPGTLLKLFLNTWLVS